MIDDFRSAYQEGEIAADVCIIGAGAAGIALALALLETHHHVCLLESGGLRAEAETQSLYRGEVVGMLWRAGLEDCRARFFGGTTNRWPGGCFPLDAITFEERAWVPHSGWPFLRSHLDPWYERARSVLALPDTPMDEGGSIRRDPPPFPFDPERLVHRRSLVSRHRRLGLAHRSTLMRASNVRILLHANLTELIPNERASHIVAARIRTLEGVQGLVRARCFVLACGGIENARLLLLSNSVVRSGLGNDHDLVGRFFMDHPGARLGTITSEAPRRLADPYDKRGPVKGAPRPGDLVLSRSIQTRRRLLSARVRPQDYENEDTIPDGVLALRQLLDGLRGIGFHGDWAHVAWRTATEIGDILPAIRRRLRGELVVPSHRIDCEGYFEQAPNPDSRITLADSTDALGQRRVRLDWRLTELDRRTFRATAQIFGGEIERLGLGCLHPEPWLRAGEGAAPEIHEMAHHLGTTRMADDPSEGVVDSDCRVHGVDNLFIAGGSVFPTSGWAPSTYTIVALALRLADHLGRILYEGPATRACGLTRPLSDRKTAPEGPIANHTEVSRGP